MIRIDENSPTTKCVLSTVQCLTDKSFHPTGDQKIDTYLKAWLSTQGQDELNNKEVRKELSNLLKNNKERLSIFYTYIYANSERLNINDREKRDALSYLFDNALISKGIIENLNTEERNGLFRKWVIKKVKDFRVKYSKSDSNDGFWGRGLFCDFDAKHHVWWGGEKNYLFYYDYKALHDLHEKGKYKAYKLTHKCTREVIYELDNYFTIIITREGLFSDDYDALLFGPDHLWLVQDIEDNDGLNEDRKLFLKEYYKDINLGTDEITLNNEIYKNATLFYLLQTLHLAFKTNGKGINEEFESLMKTMVRHKLVSSWLYYPQIDSI